METSVIISWIISVIAVSPLLFGGILYLRKSAYMVKNFGMLELPLNFMPTFGLIKIAIATLVLIPATSFVGVILATGWMGGAIAMHVRVRDNYIAQIIVPILIWIGFGLRHQTEIRTLLGF